jgi:hypothetical protein
MNGLHRAFGVQGKWKRVESSQAVVSKEPQGEWVRQDARTGAGRRSGSAPGAGLLAFAASRADLTN